MMINPDYAKTILTLANMLTERGVPFTLNVNWDGLQVRFPWCSGDVICHSGSYGHTDNCVESMGFPWDEGDVSCLELEEALTSIIDWYRWYQANEE